MRTGRIQSLTCLGSPCRKGRERFHPQAPPQALFSHVVRPAQTLPQALVPEGRPTASLPWGVRAQQATGQLAGVWPGCGREPREVPGGSSLISPLCPQEGELLGAGLGPPQQHRAQGWDPKGCRAQQRGPQQAPPPCPLFDSGARALSIPWGGGCLGPGTSQQGDPMPRTRPGTGPQGERRRMGAKACQIAGQSGPNHSPCL